MNGPDALRPHEQEPRSSRLSRPAIHARIADRIEIVSHPHEGPATDVRLAVAWHPPDDAFERYPNLQAVCSIGAGVDNILVCPSLRPDIEVIRVVDPEQAQMMAGFVPGM